jgi:hypothetical protein
MRNVFWIIVSAVLAITVHISTVLFAPGFLFDRNLDQLARDVPDNTFFILPTAAQSKIFPEYPSGTVFGLCRFNLTSGPITLDAAFPRDLDAHGLFQVWKDALHGHRRTVRRQHIQLQWRWRPACLMCFNKGR